MAVNSLVQRDNGKSESHAYRHRANPLARAVVKTADVNDKVQRECLLREYNNHRRPRIASSKHFRKIFDTIDDQTSWTAQKPFCLALEWMDTTLADIPTESHIENPVLIASLFKTVLGGFGELEQEHIVYTGTPFAPWRYPLQAGYTKHSRLETCERSRLRH